MMFLFYSLAFGTKYAIFDLKITERKRRWR